MSEKVVFVPNGEKIYAVPSDVCEKYELTGDELEAAKSALGSDGDVEGQWSPSSKKTNSYGETWQRGGNISDDPYEWVRTPWND